MTNKSKAKGTAAETAVVHYLQENGFPYAERRALAGSLDRGDVTGVPGVVIEVKSCARMELATWVDEAEAEALNGIAANSSQRDIAAVWHKRRGKGSPGEWYVTMTGEQFVELIR